jgi:hypothetical protein
MVMAVQIGIGPRDWSERATLHVETGGELEPDALASLGLEDWGPARRPLVDATLSESNACGADGTAELAVAVVPGTVSGVYVHLRRNDDDKGEGRSYTVVRVIQDEPAGGSGITYVATER